MDIEQIAINYGLIFNDSLKVPQIHIDLINNAIQDINIKNFNSIQLTIDELKSALKSTSTSKACGNDGTSLYMLHNCEPSFIEKIIYPLFINIFKLCILPTYLNITHIIPILKDNKKPTDTINNLRPIFISNPFAQVFERILLNKIPSILNTHQNQFGYKNKTSCSHALFAF